MVLRTIGSLAILVCFAGTATMTFLNSLSGRLEDERGEGWLEVGRPKGWTTTNYGSGTVVYCINQKNLNGENTLCS